MKTLLDYTRARSTELLKSTGSFFAFNQKQWDENKVEGIKYKQVPVGLFVPFMHFVKVSKDFETIIYESIAQDIEENGKPAIIWRELAARKAYNTLEVFGTVQALEGYYITEDEVEAEFDAFFQHCVDNGL
jgi:hypothetical protein